MSTCVDWLLGTNGSAYAGRALSSRGNVRNWRGRRGNARQNGAHIISSHVIRRAGMQLWPGFAEVRPESSNRYILLTSHAADPVRGIHALRTQKDQHQVGHTIHPSCSGRQASERHPYCHRESVAAYQQLNLAAWKPVQRQRQAVCVSETSSSSPSIETQLTLPACRRSCDRACGASRFG